MNKDEDVLQDKIIGVSNGFGAGVRAGLCNQRQEFFGLVLIASENNMKICQNTLLWRKSWKTYERIPHDLLWNTDMWSDILPPLTNNNPTIWVTSDMLWKHHEKYVTQLRNDPECQRSPLEKVFFESIRPMTEIQSIIDKFISNKKYVALHARIEDDLKLNKHMFNSKTTLKKLYNNISNQIQPEQHLFLATSLVDVKNYEDRNIILQSKSPWSHCKLVLGAGNQKQLPHIIRSIVDFEVCVHAETFIGTSMSTFSNSIVYARCLAFSQPNNWTYTANNLTKRSDDGRVAWEWTRGNHDKYTD